MRDLMEMTTIISSFVPSTQSIRVKSKKGYDFSLDIDWHCTHYTSDVLILPPDSNATLWKSCTAPTGKEALTDALKYLATILTNNDDALEIIDNPCNALMVSADVQEQILASLNQSCPVLVNGKR
jgi:hypothetical protein